MKTYGHVGDFQRRMIGGVGVVSGVEVGVVVAAVVVVVDREVDPHLVVPVTSIAAMPAAFRIPSETSNWFGASA